MIIDFSLFSCNKIKMSTYKPLYNFSNMTVNNVIWGVLGLTVGIFNNNFIVFLSNKLNITSLLIQNLIQLAVCSSLLAIINTYFNFFGWSWQNTTPGLFFVSFFFGVQFKMITNIQNSYILEDTIGTIITTSQKPFRSLIQ
jgi:hypothetical protein